MADEAQAAEEVQNSEQAQAPAPEERIAQLEAEIAKLKDEHLRALAEVENTRRRGERQAQEAKAYAIDRFARDLLPVADTMSRALGSVSPEVRAADEAVRNLFEGVELTERALIEAFTRHGLKRLGERGERFDPNLHQAVAQIPSDAPAGAIAEVMQVGYALNDRTLRAAIVAVSTGPAPAEPAPQASRDDAPPGAALDIKV
ncbi:MAG: nucleotide exchange factor GrpE [Hydrogenophilaceae bacterium]|jgi:molecular chaperone GrpE|nr:nucleotide exchange factor GrpE [Hydrogenophilaceae bacterium]